MRVVVLLLSCGFGLLTFGITGTSDARVVGGTVLGAAIVGAAVALLADTWRYRHGTAEGYLAADTIDRLRALHDETNERYERYDPP